jgi:predicted transcriptional regulator
MEQTIQVSIQVPEELAKAMKDLAKATGRKLSWLWAQAGQAYLNEGETDSSCDE